MEVTNEDLLKVLHCLYKKHYCCLNFMTGVSPDGDIRNKIILEIHDEDNKLILCKKFSCPDDLGEWIENKIEPQTRSNLN